MTTREYASLRKRALTLNQQLTKLEALELAVWLIEEGSPYISITVEPTQDGGLVEMALTFKTLADALTFERRCEPLLASFWLARINRRANAASSTGSLTKKT